MPIPRSWHLHALVISTILLLATPVLAKPSSSDEALIRQIERLEELASGRSTAANESEQTLRLMREVRSLRQQARQTEASELDRRLAALELRLRTGKSMTPRTQAEKQTSLDKQGAISGTVTDSSSGNKLAVDVYIWDATGNLWDLQYTGNTGTYSFQNLDPGQYFVSTQNYYGYIDELYDDIPCGGGAYNGCDPTLGTSITVVDQGTTDHIDFALDLGGSISGSVTDAGTGEPVLFGYLQLWNEAGELVTEYYLGGSITYLLTGLDAGNYFVNTLYLDGHQDELYDDIPCPGGGFDGCDPTTGNAIAVALGIETSGIDFAVKRLGSIQGRITDGLTGEPIPGVSLYASTSENSYSGYGYSNNNGEYEIAGLTEGTYFVTTSNYWGFDEELYDDLPCPSGNCDLTTGTPIGVYLNQTTSGIDFILEGGCVESERAMCLNGDRFRVEATWRNFAGNSGSGRSVELTGDSGYFWFFGDTNIEMVVKVLNACNLPGFNNFWVFAGGLTNVEVTLTVTDTQTGQVREYHNPIGTPFQPIQDTGAFNTCP